VVFYGGSSPRKTHNLWGRPCDYTGGSFFEMEEDFMKHPVAANDNIKGVVLLRFPDLKAWKGITYSRVHLARLEQANEFPKRVRLTANTVAWVESEIDAHVAAKMAAR
jgi:prophage regulatory protein